MTSTAGILDRSPRSNRLTIGVVWGVWAAMLVVALVCIVRYGRDIPMAEDWTLVPPLTGHQPDFGAWLWSQNNEHRVPLPRLLLLAVLRLSGGDFRAGMFLSTLTMGALSAALMLTARRIRGSTSLVDAWFPIALLSLGNWINLIWSWQIQFVSSVALIGALLIVIVGQTGLLSARSAIVAAVALILLPLTGAIGLIFDLALAPWVIGTARLHFCARSTVERQRGLLLAVALGVSAITGVLYFVGYQRPPWNPPSPGNFATLKTAAMFFAYGLGPVANTSWPVSVAAAALLLTPTAWILFRSLLRTSGADRLRAFGLASFAGAMAVLALGIGYGRAAQVPTVGFPDRYVLFAMPAYVVSFFVWQLYGSRQATSVVHALVLIAFVALLPVNSSRGLSIRDWYVASADSVQHDISAGRSPEAIAKDHRAFLMHWDEPGLAQRIHWLQEAGIGPFARGAR